MKKICLLIFFFFLLTTQPLNWFHRLLFRALPDEGIQAYNHNKKIIENLNTKRKEEERLEELYQDPPQRPLVPRTPLWLENTYASLTDSLFVQKNKKRSGNNRIICQENQLLKEAAEIKRKESQEKIEKLMKKINAYKEENDKIKAIIRGYLDRLKKQKEEYRKNHEWEKNKEELKKIFTKYQEEEKNQKINIVF
jgi:hypothetical protein